PPRASLLPAAVGEDRRGGEGFGGPRRRQPDGVEVWLRLVRGGADSPHARSHDPGRPAPRRSPQSRDRHPRHVRRAGAGRSWPRGRVGVMARARWRDVPPEAGRLWVSWVPERWPGSAAPWVALDRLGL